MTQKEAKAIREQALTTIEEKLEFEGFAIVGRTSEGIAFEDVETGTAVVFRPIVKSEGTDIHELVAEFEKKQEAKHQKEKEKEEKAK